MNTITPSSTLRRVLQLDAAASAGLGLLQVAATGTLAAWLGLAAPLLWATGVFLLLYASALLMIARRERVARAWIQVLVVGNLGWALGCVGVALAWPGVSALGLAYLLLQAAAVLGFAALQVHGLRRSAAASSRRPAQSALAID